MRALEITEPGQVRLITIEEPTAGDGEVLLQVHKVGYCGTDLSTFRGANPLVTYPRIPGHEVSGVIIEVGPGVDNWQVGQSVLVFPYTECGECSSCRAARPNCCKNNQTLGVQRNGAMANLVALPADKMMSADGLSHRELALVEPLTVGAHAVARGQVSEGEHVVVFGCGAIGLGAVAAAATRGAKVVAVDIDDDKLALAISCGANDCINSSTTDLAKTIEKLTDGHGPAVTIEAVGLPATFQAAVDIVAFAGRVVYIGYTKKPVEYETKFFVMKEIDIRGSRNALREDFESVIAMLQSGKIPTDKIVTRDVNLDDACQALQDWDASPGSVTKVHVSFQ